MVANNGESEEVANTSHMVFRHLLFSRFDLTLKVDTCRAPYGNCFYLRRRNAISLQLIGLILGKEPQA